MGDLIDIDFTTAHPDNQVFGWTSGSVNDLAQFYNDPNINKLVFLKSPDCNVRFYVGRGLVLEMKSLTSTIIQNFGLMTSLQPNTYTKLRVFAEFDMLEVASSSISTYGDENYFRGGVAVVGVEEDTANPYLSDGILDPNPTTRRTGYGLQYMYDPNVPVAAGTPIASVPSIRLSPTATDAARTPFTAYNFFQDDWKMPKRRHVGDNMTLETLITASTNAATKATVKEDFTQDGLAAPTINANSGYYFDSLPMFFAGVAINVISGTSEPRSYGPTRVRIRRLTIEHS